MIGTRHWVLGARKILKAQSLANMTTTKVYNLEGNIVGEIELPAGIFGVKVNSELIHEVVTAKQANARKVIAHTKTRGEVSGGGRKPWRQKGTGRARHGSIRSPIWKGGGVVFGPRNTRNYGVKINSKVSRATFLMALSDRATNDKIFVLDELTLPSGKTKDFKKIFNKLGIEKKVLVILPGKNENVMRASKNLPNILTRTANATSIIDVLGNKTLVMSRKTIDELEKIYSKK